MQKIDIKNYCAPGTNWTDKMVAISDDVSLRVIEFFPAKTTAQPTVLFVAGWISLMKGWKLVLQEITKDFHVIYLETREKNTSEVKNINDFSVEAIASDLVRITEIYGLREKRVHNVR